MEKLGFIIILNISLSANTVHAICYFDSLSKGFVWFVGLLAAVSGLNPNTDWVVNSWNTNRLVYKEENYCCRPIKFINSTSCATGDYRKGCDHETKVLADCGITFKNDYDVIPQITDYKKNKKCTKRCNVDLCREKCTAECGNKYDVCFVNAFAHLEKCYNKIMEVVYPQVEINTCKEKTVVKLADCESKKAECKETITDVCNKKCDEQKIRKKRKCDNKVVINGRIEAWVDDSHSIVTEFPQFYTKKASKKHKKKHP